MRFWGSSKLDEIGWCWMHIQAWIWWQGILLQSQFSLFLCILKPEAYAQKLDRSKTPAQLHVMNWHPDLFHTNTFTQRLLHTETFTHRSFYTQTLLHTDAFTHRSFHTHRSFYTQTLLHTEAKGLRRTRQNRSFSAVFGDRTSFRAKGLRPDAWNRNFTGPFANRNFTAVFGDRTSFHAKFYLSFWWSNLVSCERVAFRAVSLALPRGFKREI